MTGNKTIKKLLRLKDMKVVGFAFKRWNELLITVKPYKNGCLCPECGRRGRIMRNADGNA